MAKYDFKPKTKLSHKRFDEASQFDGDGWISADNLEWICPHCNSGADDPEEARFTAHLAQWYEWDIDGLGERRTRYGIVSIDSPKAGDKVKCRSCNKEFKLKTKGTKRGKS